MSSEATPSRRDNIAMITVTLVLCILFFGGIIWTMTAVKLEAFESGATKKQEYASCVNKDNHRDCFTKLAAREYVCWYNSDSTEECVHVDTYYEARDFVAPVEEAK